MSYYTGRGDYYSGKGDLKSIVGGILNVGGKIAGAVIPGAGGVIQAGTSLVSRAISGTSAARPVTTTTATLPRIPAQPTPGLSGTLARALPGGSSGYSCASGACDSGYHLDKTTRSKCVRNRKVNYTNPRALSRATKRLDGFVTVARRAMKSTNYKVVSKSYKQNYRKPLKR